MGYYLEVPGDIQNKAEQILRLYKGSKEIKQLVPYDKTPEGFHQVVVVKNPQFDACLIIDCQRQYELNKESMEDEVQRATERIKEEAQKQNIELTNARLQIGISMLVRPVRYLLVPREFTEKFLPKTPTG